MDNGQELLPLCLGMRDTETEVCKGAVSLHSVFACGQCLLFLDLSANHCEYSDH